MKNKIITALIIILFAGVYLTGCESTSAEQYKIKYEQQLIVTDSLQITITKLQQIVSTITIRTDSIYRVSSNKIDSLKLVVVRKDSLISFHNTNVNLMLRSIQTGLENLSASSLQYLISIQKK